MKKAKALLAGTAVWVGVMNGYANAENSRLEVAETIEAQYISKLGCAVTDVAFREESRPPDFEYDNGLNVAARVKTPGEVLIAEASLYQMGEGEFNKLIAHEMTHVCAGPLRLFERPIKGVNGDRLLGARGFVVLGDNPTQPDKTLMFTLIEEGAATVLQDAITSQTGEGYTFEGYAAVRNLTARLQNEHEISDKQLANMVQNSQLMEFVAIVNGLDSAEEAGRKELAYVMWMYDQAYKSATETPGASKLGPS